MPFLRLILIGFCVSCLCLAGRGQSAGWKTVVCGKVSLKYPPTWHETRETRGSEVRITLTQRRYVKVADPGIERDVKAIFDSIKFRE